MTRHPLFLTVVECAENYTDVIKRNGNTAERIFQSNLTYGSSDACTQLLLLCSSFLYVESLWPSDAMWRHGSRSILAQLMAWCLTTPSHYLNQCWLITSEVLRHSHEIDITGNAQDSHLCYEFENYYFFFKITASSPRGQWVNEIKNRNFFILLPHHLIHGVASTDIFFITISDSLYRLLLAIVKLLMSPVSTLGHVGVPNVYHMTAQYMTLSRISTDGFERSRRGIYL